MFGGYADAVWDRIDGLRVMELGTPGEQRALLNGLVLSGAKRATTGLASEYAEEGEPVEHVGERMHLVDDEMHSVGLIEVTGVEIVPFGEVTFEFAAAEGEGDPDIESWRAGHLRFFAEYGATVSADSPMACIRFRLVTPGADSRASRG